MSSARTTVKAWPPAARRRAGAAPAFFKLTGGSFGFQAGGQASDLVLIVRTDDGMQHLLQSKFKLGADASAAAGPVGRDAQAMTDLTMRAQVLTYSRSRGLFLGVSLSGGVINQDQADTQAFYGKDWTYSRGTERTGRVSKGGGGVPADGRAVCSDAATENGADFGFCAEHSANEPVRSSRTADRSNAVGGNDSGCRRGRKSGSGNLIFRAIDSIWRNHNSVDRDDANHGCGASVFADPLPQLRRRPRLQPHPLLLRRRVRRQLRPPLPEPRADGESVTGFPVRWLRPPLFCWRALEPGDPKEYENLHHGGTKICIQNSSNSKRQ